MKFSDWSFTDLIMIAAIIVQFIFLFGQLDSKTEELKASTEQLGKQIDKQGEALLHAIERLEDKMDKRFNLIETRLDTLNQNYIDHLAHHNRGE